MREPPALSRWIAAGAIVACWLFVSCAMFVTLELVVVDDETQGWAGLWPFLVAYGLFTALMAGGVIMLLRLRRTSAAEPNNR